MRKYIALAIAAVALLFSTPSEARRRSDGWRTASHCRSSSCWDRNPSGYRSAGAYSLGGGRRSRY